MIDIFSTVILETQTRGSNSLNIQQRGSHLKNDIDIFTTAFKKHKQGEVIFKGQVSLFNELDISATAIR